MDHNQFHYMYNQNSLCSQNLAYEIKYKVLLTGIHTLCSHGDVYERLLQVKLQLRCNNLWSWFPLTLF